MKLLSKSIFIVSFIMVFTACKKENQTAVILSKGSGAKYSPNFVSFDLYNFDYVRTRYNSFAFFDLYHADNKDKKYFIAERIHDDSDSLRIVQMPYPIDSIALDWPSHIKDAFHGTTRDIHVDAKTRATAFDGKNGKWSIDEITGFHWNSPFFTGNMFNKTPVARTMVWAEDSASYPELGRYFQINIYPGGLVVGGPNVEDGTVRNISEVEPGAAGYDWDNVSSMFGYENNSGFTIAYFLDAKNWRYFTQEFKCQQLDCAIIVSDWSGYKSMDGLLKWPEGWGKK